MTFIYHITHLRNLPNILNDGGLCCDRVVSQRNLAHVSIAHQHIKDRRAQKEVPCPPGGFLADYVPFYFAPRSPMLYTIHKGNVEGYQGEQESILHLVASAEQVVKSKLAYTFTDGHADVDLSCFFTDLSDLDKIDWDIMKEKYWNDTIADGDRKRRRQAEFLVYEFFPINLLISIGVINDKIEQQVKYMLQNKIINPAIKVIPAWYY